MERDQIASIALLTAEDSRYRADAKAMLLDSLANAEKSVEFVSVKVYSSQEFERGEISTALAIIFIIEADRGISGSEIASFLQLRELQLPTLILVAGLEPQTKELKSDSGTDFELLDQSAWDFDDMVTLCSRVLEPVLAPYLVLHHEDGHPSGYFDLQRSQVIEYRDGERITRNSDQELLEVVAEFQKEFDQSDYEVNDFLQGNTVLAIPYIPERGMGEVEIRDLVTMLLKAQL